MYTIEVNLKQSPLPLMVQKESLDAAESDYRRILDAIQSGSSGIIELTCDQVSDKRLSVLTGEVAAVQLYEKSGTASASGKAPGFFALVGEAGQ